MASRTQDAETSDLVEMIVYGVAAIGIVMIALKSALHLTAQIEGSDPYLEFVVSLMVVIVTAVGWETWHRHMKPRQKKTGGLWLIEERRHMLIPVVAAEAVILTVAVAFWMA